MSHQLRSTFNVRDLKVFQNTYWCQYARTSGKSSVSVLGDMGSFFYLEKKDDLIDWELTLPSRFEVRLKGVCLYHKQDFDRRLSESDKQKLTEHHDKTLHLLPSPIDR